MYSPDNIFTTTIDKAEADSPEASYQNMLKDTEEKAKAMLIEKITQKLGKPAKPKTETTPTKKTTIVDDDAIEVPDGQVRQSLASSWNLLSDPSSAKNVPFGQDKH